MHPSQRSAACPACGHANSLVATTCATCGASLVSAAMLGDPQANTVSGAPVPNMPREFPTSVDAARERLGNLGPELSAKITQAVSRQISYRGRSFDLAERFKLMIPLPQRPLPVPVPPRALAPPIPARAVWFLLVGTWLSCLWVLATWAILCLFVFGQTATRMLTLIPSVLTLRPADNPPRSIIPVEPNYMSGISIASRVVYTVLVGWWASLIWMLAAYAISLTIIGIPIGYRMYSLAPTIALLQGV
jgi:uncharacterized membrane protein YccF (DUF307 family)